MKKEKRQYAPLEIRICGDQLITKDYLQEFKEELLTEIGRMLQNGGKVEANTEIVRPGRFHPRKKKPPRLYYMTYKDL